MGGEGDKEKKRESLKKKTLTIRENDIHSKHNSCPSIWLCVFDEIRWKQKGTEKTKKKIIIIETVLLRLTTRLKTKH